MQGQRNAPRKRVPRAEREGLMLDAAERIFGEAGFTGASMDDIAQASGITKGLLYEYFGSKEALYAAFYERERGRLFDSIEAALEGVPHGLPRLRVVIDSYFAFLEQNRGKRWLIYSEVPQDTADALRLLNSESIARMLREGAPVPIDEAEIEMLAHALVGAGEQVGRWWLEQPQRLRGEVVERFEAMATALITDAIRRSEAGGG